MNADLENGKDLELANDKVNEEKEITSESLRATTKIHGWLWFFLFCIIVGGFISAIRPIVEFDIDDYGGSYILGMTDISSGVLLFALAIYTLYAFCRRNPDAVFLGKTYVVFCAVSNALVLLAGGPDNDSSNDVAMSIRSLVWGLAWFLYLTYSHQVKEVVPKSFRHVSNRDYYIILLMIVVPVFCLIVGQLEVRHIYDKRSENNLMELQSNLKENEYTDGFIVFTCPSGFQCTEEEDEDGMKMYTLERESVAIVFVCSDLDSSAYRDIDKVWNGWEDPEYAKCTSTVLQDDCYDINGHSCYIKVKKYTVDDSEIYWRFVAMFNSESKLVCLVSAYDGGEDAYLDELLNSVRFGH